MHEKIDRPSDASEVAEQLAKELAARGHDYALGGAIALSYWAQPRGTLDVDLTLFLPADKPPNWVGCWAT